MDGESSTLFIKEIKGSVLESSDFPWKFRPSVELAILSSFSARGQHFPAWGQKRMKEWNAVSWAAVIQALFSPRGKIDPGRLERKKEREKERKRERKKEREIERNSWTVVVVGLSLSRRTELPWHYFCLQRERERENQANQTGDGYCLRGYT